MTQLVILSDGDHGTATLIKYNYRDATNMHLCQYCSMWKIVKLFCFDYYAANSGGARKVATNKF